MKTNILILVILVVSNLLVRVDSNWLQGLLGRFRPGKNKGDLQKAQGEALGLRNLGNTCYFNSVLQGLFHVREFRDKVIGTEFTDCSVGSELKQVFRDLSKLGNSRQLYVDPFALVQSLGINVAIQEDAEEFYLRLMNAVDGDVVKKGGQTSLLSSVFAGETQQTLRCVSVDLLNLIPDSVVCLM